MGPYAWFPPWFFLSCSVSLDHSKRSLHSYLWLWWIYYLQIHLFWGQIVKILYPPTSSPDFLFWDHFCMPLLLLQLSRFSLSDSVRPQRWQPTRLPHPWDSPGKNTGVGCHCLLQCMKVKSESEVSQLCPTLSDPMDCSPPGSSVHGIFQARVLEWVAITFCMPLLLY